MEVWEDVNGFNTFYQVSNLGKIRSKDRIVTHWRGGKRLVNGRCLNIINRKGYATVNFCVNYDRIMKMIHRVVAETFISNPENKPTVNHKDGNKLNNHVDNLEWATLKEQANHAVANGLWKYPKGDDSVRTKVKFHQVKEIRLLKSAYSRKDLSEMYNCSKSLICMIINHKCRINA